MSPIKYADIIIPLPVGDVFTYAIPQAIQDNINIGMRVIVQFGQRKFYSGIVHKIHKNKPNDNFDIKYIESILDEKPIITKKQIELWEWTSQYYCCSIGEVYKAALPSGLKLESKTKFLINPEYSDFETLTGEQEKIMLLLSGKGLCNIADINKVISKKTALPLLKKLIDKNAILIEEKITETYRAKTKAYIALHPNILNECKINETLDELSHAKKQKKLLSFFLSMITENNQKIEKQLLLNKSNVSNTILRELIKKEILTIIDVEIGRLKMNNDSKLYISSLSQAQQTAFEHIKEQFLENKPVLLHGVTSSGKTEIYIKLIEEQIKLGKQVLYLVPEIGLTTQLTVRIKHAFGNKVGIYHSQFSDSERVEIWNKTLNHTNNYSIIIGTRSASLLPFSNLGLIIVDEEHEQSYKQFDLTPRYHARDLAIVLAHIHNAKILLGSATPSFESYFNAKSGKYGLVELNERFSGVELPDIIIADIKEAYRKREMKSIFSPQLYNAIELALKNEQQIIIFQNRRGYAPYIQCKDCSWIPKCKNCDVSLTYHKKFNYLNCHYCAMGTNYPEICPQCGNTHINTCGYGTEKIEEEIEKLFPDAKIARMDLDSTRSKNAYTKIISDFEDKNIDILVGTQMVSKGLDFEHVSVVGILNADQLINFPDFRAFERSYQMLTQVSGRAGRRNNQGKVIIQTMQHDHQVLEMVKQHKFDKLFNQTLIERKLFKYPPYFRLVKIVLKHRFKETLNPAATLLAQQLRKHFGMYTLGPEYPLIPRIQAQYQKEIWVKLARNAHLANAKATILHEISKIKKQKNNSNITIYIDVDPM